MNCSETTRLLDAHLDGELDLKDSLAVEEHLERCVRCGNAFAALRAAREAIARHAQAPVAPGDLRERIAPVPATAGRAGRWLRSPLAAAAPGIAALLLAGWMFLEGAVQRPAAHARVVYHISSSDTASAALRNLANHLRAAPDVKVVVVAHSEGVDFLLAGARDEAGEPFESRVREFGQRGVEFRICYNTLERRGIGPDRIVPGATLVPSGIAEIGRLQAKEGYAYMRL